MLSFECIKNEKSVYFLLTSAWGNEVESTVPDFGTNCPEVSGARKEVSHALCKCPE